MSSDQQTTQTQAQTPRVAGQQNNVVLSERIAKSLEEFNFGKYQDQLEHKYSKLISSTILYEKLQMLSDSQVSFNVLGLKHQAAKARLRAFQTYLTNNRGLLSAYFKENYGVSEQYVELIFHPKMNEEIQYILDNADSYTEAKLNTEWYLASFVKGLRNAPIGFVVIAANDDLESVVKNIGYNLLAGNMIGLSLSPNLSKHESLVRFFKGFEQEQPEGLKNIPSLSDLEGFSSNQVALINAVGYDQIGDEFKPVLAQTGARVLAQSSKLNICILDQELDSTTLKKAVLDIFDNKVELAGRSSQAIGQIFVHRSVSSQFIQKLDILIEREFIDNSRVSGFYGSLKKQDVEAAVGQQLDKKEFANLFEDAPNGVFKPLIIVNPKNEVLGLKNSKLPLFVIHEYDSHEDLLARVTKIDQNSQKVGNVYFYEGSTSANDVMSLAIRVPCWAFHQNTTYPTLRNSVGSSEVVQPPIRDTSLLGGFNGVTVFSKRQTFTRRLFRGIDRTHLYPLTPAKFDMLAALNKSSWLSKNLILKGALGTLGVCAIWSKYRQIRVSQQAAKSK